MKISKNILFVIVSSVFFVFSGCANNNDANGNDIMDTTNKNVSLDNITIEDKIPINIDLLEDGGNQFLGEFYLEKDAIIIYNIDSKGTGNINIGFTTGEEYSEENLCLGHTKYTGNILNDNMLFANTTSLKAGEYNLWISSFDGELSNIQGTVTIGKI